MKRVWMTLALITFLGVPCYAQRLGGERISRDRTEGFNEGRGSNSADRVRDRDRPEREVKREPASPIVIRTVIRVVGKLLKPTEVEDEATEQGRLREAKEQRAREKAGAEAKAKAEAAEAMERWNSANRHRGGGREP